MGLMICRPADQTAADAVFLPRSHLKATDSPQKPSKVYQAHILDTTPDTVHFRGRPEEGIEAVRSETHGRVLRRRRMAASDYGIMSPGLRISGLPCLRILIGALRFKVVSVLFPPASTARNITRSRFCYVES